MSARERPPATAPARLGRRDREPHARIALFRAMEELLRHQRLDEISVAELVRTAGVSRGAFYQHFDSKFSIVAELLEDNIQELWAPLLTSDGPIREDVLVEVLTAMAEHWTARGAFLAAAVEGSHSNPEIYERWKQVRDDFDRALADRIRRSDTPVADPEGLAVGLGATVERCVYLNVTGAGALADSSERLVDIVASIWLGALNSERLRSRRTDPEKDSSS